MTLALRLVSLVALTLLVGWPGCSSAHEVTVTLESQNNSGESGTAILTESDNDQQTKVEVTVTGQPAGMAQPLHIHKGTCANLDPSPAYGLPALTEGKSDATIDVPLETLQAGPYAINGHKSAQEAGVYVFCGNIPAE